MTLTNDPMAVDAAPAAQSTSVELSSMSEFNAYRFNAEISTYLLIHIKAPDASEATNRAPIRVSAVLDRSGSMSGAKLELCKGSIAFALRQLKHQDKLGVITYDDTVDVCVALKPMDAANKQDALNSVKEIRDGGCTNLAGGLVAGIRQTAGLKPVEDGLRGVRRRAHPAVQQQMAFPRTPMRRPPSPGVPLGRAPDADGNYRMRVLIGNDYVFDPPNVISRMVQSVLPGKPTNEHKWTLFVRAAEDGASPFPFVKRAEFHLHPSFKPSLVAVEGSSAFELTRRGWGTFQVKVVLTLYDGSQRTFTHGLSFDGNGAAAEHTLELPASAVAPQQAQAPPSPPQGLFGPGAAPVANQAAAPPAFALNAAAPPAQGLFSFGSAPAPAANQAPAPPSGVIQQQQQQQQQQQEPAAAASSLAPAPAPAGEKVADPPAEGEVVSCMLFTDGLANVGAQSAEDVIKEMRAALALSPSCSVFTFGYGADHNPDMMKAIADAGRGVYYYVSQESEIPGAFADCLGGLVSVCAQSLALSITGLNGARVEEVVTAYPTAQDGAASVVSIPDLYSEEERDVLVRVTLPALANPVEEIGALRLVLNYRNLLTGAAGASCDLTATVSRPAEVPPHMLVRPTRGGRPAPGLLNGALTGALARSAAGGGGGPAGEPRGDGARPRAQQGARPPRPAGRGAGGAERGRRDDRELALGERGVLPGPRRRPARLPGRPARPPDVRGGRRQEDDHVGRLPRPAALRRRQRPQVPEQDEGGLLQVGEHAYRRLVPYTY